MERSISHKNIPISKGRSLHTTLWHETNTSTRSAKKSSSLSINFLIFLYNHPSLAEDLSPFWNLGIRFPWKLLLFPGRPNIFSHKSPRNLQSFTFVKSGNLQHLSSNQFIKEKNHTVIWAKFWVKTKGFGKNHRILNLCSKLRKCIKFPHKTLKF